MSNVPKNDIFGTPDDGVSDALGELAKKPNLEGTQTDDLQRLTGEKVTFATWHRGHGSTYPAYSRSE